MSLEIRIETLEHELKILKNEIESTLLEIQNQVLIHYYPSLRAENSTPPKDLSPLLASPPTQKGDEGQGKGNGRHRSVDDGYAPPITKPPITKEVSLTEVARKSKQVPIFPAEQPAHSNGHTNGNAVSGPGAVIDQASFTHLAKWVNDAVEKIGKERTQEMIESHANAEYCTPAITDILLQFVSLSEEENPPEQVETKELMDVLLKLNRVLPSVRVKEKSVG